MTRPVSNINDGKIRCGWVGNKPHYLGYHDEEWGIPVHDEHRHFEMLVLEGAQAGLSWSTILLRREGYRKAFAQFDPAKVARFDTRKQAALLNNTGIIRNRLKIKSAINNAKAFLKIQEEYGTFDAYIWRFVGGTPKINHWTNMSKVPVTTSESDALSQDLKKRGFSFVGSIVMYAHMQATGLVNDHTTDCFCHPLHAKNRTPQNKPTKKIVSLLSSSSIDHQPCDKVPKKNTKILKIKVKRIYEPVAPEDGFRVLVDRLWPRGLSKQDTHVDLWIRDLAPSTALRKWFNHETTRWKEFTRRYAAELDQQPEALERLMNIGQKGPLTFLYSSANPQHNNAVALKAYVDKAVRPQKTQKE